MTNISDLHFENISWNNDLKFQRDELNIFQKRLEEVAPRYTAKAIQRRVEQFQNKFIRHFEVLDTLVHDIKIHENHLSDLAKAEPPASVDLVNLEDHIALRESVESQVEIYKELKKNFMRFLTQTM